MPATAGFGGDFGAYELGEDGRKLKSVDPNNVQMFTSGTNAASKLEVPGLRPGAADRIRQSAPDPMLASSQGGASSVAAPAGGSGAVGGGFSPQNFQSASNVGRAYPLAQNVDLTGFSPTTKQRIDVFPPFKSELGVGGSVLSPPL